MQTLSNSPDTIDLDVLTASIELNQPEGSGQRRHSFHHKRYLNGEIESEI